MQGCPDGCQHRFTDPAEAQALPQEGASALVFIDDMALGAFGAAKMCLSICDALS